jgi:glycosyltransferase involved in cell wall biosynthesis
MGTPLVSVIITVFNKADRLEATLRSLLSQSQQDFEVICVDDGSSDGSARILEEAASGDPRIRVLRFEDNRGPSIRLNDGAAIARGEWLHLMDGDDLAAPNAQAWLLDGLHRYGDALFYGRRVAGEQSVPIPPDAAVLRIAGPLAFCAARPVTHMALMVRRDLFLAAGGADPAVFIQDQSLPLRLSARCRTMLWSDAAICFAPARGDGNLSRNRVQQNHDRFLAALNLLEDLPEGSDGAREVRALAAGALFKLERETGKRSVPTSLRYVLAKLGVPPGRRWLASQRSRVASVPGVRRPAPTATASARRSTASGAGA